MGVAIVNLAVSAENYNSRANLKILGLVVVLLAQGHTGAVRENGLLGQLLALEQHREREAAAVLFVDLLYLDRVVAQEVVEGVELFATIVASVIPADIKRQDVAVVLEEAVEVLVRTAALKEDLDVVFVFSQIRRILLKVYHCTSSGECVLREGLSLT